MPIHLLPPETAAKIAAGEVVERPASVAKELIENALDAGATRIDVEAQAGGVGLLRVVDNGCGIPVEEVEAAFARYATSKLSVAGDLERIATLGFRGEALPSIVAVAEVSLVSRPPGQVAGSFIRLADGKVVDKGARGAPPGTSVTVRNLFRSTPARLKFLRSNAAEAGRITTLVGHYALAYPEVRFSLSVDSRSTFSSQGDGDLRQALVKLYGLETAQAMLPVQHQERIAELTLAVGGLASPPSLSRANRSYVTLFVNRRPVQSRALTAAVLEAYQGLLMTGRYPLAVVNLTIDPGEVDVNVHPAKAEVRFRDEGVAFTAVHRAVQEALAQSAPARPVSLGVPPWGPSQEVPLHLGSQPGIPEPAPAPGLDSPVGATAPSEAGAAQGRLALPIMRVLGQLGGTYIVAEGPDGMYLIDQHAAHERVLFDQLRRDKGKGEVKAQGLLEPAPVELTPQQEGLLARHMETLHGYGFGLEPFGPRSVLVRSVPAPLSSQPPARALLDLLDRLEADDLKGYDWEDRILATVSCHGAVRAGHDLQLAEMQEMVRLLEQTDIPQSCPHGRPTMLHMSSTQLEHQFGRR